jgi:hypothetical protein
MDMMDFLETAERASCAADGHAGFTDAVGESRAFARSIDGIGRTGSGISAGA